jgi:N-acetylglucosamine kinase-like BadF-type ATPase
VPLFAGIDGGQSGTTAAIGDAQRVLARGHAGPADEVGADASSTRLRDALEGALAGALRDAGLPLETRFDALVAGISGYDGRIFGQRPRLPSEHVTLMHDAPVAHAGAFNGQAGVVVIAGTGSVGYARARDGRTRTAGGWGYLFGDEGSAFWIARTYVARAIAGDEDAAPLLRFFGVASLEELTHAVYAGAMTRHRFAAFASEALTSEPVAASAARELAQLARASAIEMPCTIAFAGGLMRNAPFKARVHDATRALLPGCALAEPLADAAEGALILARREAGVRA